MPTSYGVSPAAYGYNSSMYNSPYNSYNPYAHTTPYSSYTSGGYGSAPYCTARTHTHLGGGGFGYGGPIQAQESDFVRIAEERSRSALSSVETVVQVCAIPVCL
jgi:hypothetical protein